MEWYFGLCLLNLTRTIPFDSVCSSESILSITLDPEWNLLRSFSSYFTLSLSLMTLHFAAGDRNTWSVVLLYANFQFLRSELTPNEICRTMKFPIPGIFRVSSFEGFHVYVSCFLKRAVPLSKSNFWKLSVFERKVVPLFREMKGFSRQHLY